MNRTTPILPGQGGDLLDRHDPWGFGVKITRLVGGLAMLSLLVAILAASALAGSKQAR
ncbi:MAG: hypothetical protein ACXVRV_11700 [Gaiellaceae bacterium]